MGFENAFGFIREEDGVTIKRHPQLGFWHLCQLLRHEHGGCSDPWTQTHTSVRIKRFSNTCRIRINRTDTFLAKAKAAFTHKFSSLCFASSDSSRYVDTCRQSHAEWAKLAFASSLYSLLGIEQSSNVFIYVVTAVEQLHKKTPSWQTCNGLQEVLTVPRLIKTFQVKCQGHFLCLTRFMCVFVRGGVVGGCVLPTESLH